MPFALRGRPRTVAFTVSSPTATIVVVEAQGRQRHQGRGIRYDNDYCLVLRIEDGKIKEIREYCDSTLIERVLGPFPEARKLAAR